MNKSLSMTISYAIFLLISVLFAAGSLSLGLGGLHEPGPGFMPFIASLALCVFSVSALINNVRMLPADTSKVFDLRYIKKSMLVCGAIIAYALLVNHLGYLLSTFAFMLFLFKGIEPQKWFNAILYAALASGASYFVFVYLLKVQFL